MKDIFESELIEEINRYDEDGFIISDGEYVLYTDHKEIVDSLNKKIEAMKCCLTCEHYTEREDQEGYVICDGCIDFNNYQLKENKTE